MPITPLRITPRSEQDLLTLCEQPEQQLKDAYSRLAAEKDAIISPKVLRANLEQTLAAGVVRILIRQLIGLRSYVDQNQKTVAEALGALLLGIKEKKWPEETYKKWEGIAPIFESFLALDNIVTTAKALELSFDFEHTLRDVKILTDIRPVYSPVRDKIIGGIICNRLRLIYHDEDGSKSLSVAMDKDDLERLRSMCADALGKIELASNLLKTGSLPSFVAGEGYDDAT